MEHYFSPFKEGRKKATHMSRFFISITEQKISYLKSMPLAEYS
jgi:hypothetical protein